MRKIFISVLSVSLIFASLNLSVSAFSIDQVENNENNTSQEKYEYTYKGVDIITDVQKTEVELKELYRSAVSLTNNYNIQRGSNIGDTPVIEIPYRINRDDPGDTTVIESPPNYRTVKHNLVNVAIDATISYFARYIPGSLTKSFKRNFVTATITNFASIPESYIGSWISSYWSSAHQMRRYEATIVRYNRPYSGIKSIEVVDATHLY